MQRSSTWTKGEDYGSSKSKRVVCLIIKLHFHLDIVWSQYVVVLVALVAENECRLNHN